VRYNSLVIKFNIYIYIYWIYIYIYIIYIYIYIYWIYIYIEYWIYIYIYIIYIYIYIYIFFFLVVLGFEFRALHLLGRCSINWATLPALFCDGVFQAGLRNYLPGLALNHDPPDFCLLTSHQHLALIFRILKCKILWALCIHKVVWPP
jgi:hypothetical protein